LLVLEWQERLTDARSQEIRALTDYNKALAELYYSEGTILERNRIFTE
jgi:outer membrane protein TolC